MEDDEKRSTQEMRARETMSPHDTSAASMRASIRQRINVVSYVNAGNMENTAYMLRQNIAYPEEDLKKKKKKPSAR